MKHALSAEKPTMIFVAGFGDNASMFEGLLETDLAERFDLTLLNLPGFGADAVKGETTLTAMAHTVVEKAREKEARIVVAHSVASIIASLAASRNNCPLKIILSLEGNLTAEDAYFSGTAADYDSPNAFRAAFLSRLDQMASTTPEIARYRKQVAQADAQALWELGCDARHFSNTHHPGEVLIRAARAVYLYNPDNCSNASLEWLERADELPALVLDNATHWKSADQPEQLARKLDQALRLVS